ncbi:hypothetical protein NKJ88_31540 [Mesorhizobium sp. M0016]|uniref:hypothetical protein n=1 Tax=Mesorhizobium sp. M0016 TaxID=2956843 RepID=UPI00333BF117
MEDRRDYEIRIQADLDTKILTLRLDNVDYSAGIDVSLERRSVCKMYGRQSGGNGVILGYLKTGAVLPLPQTDSSVF